MDASRQHAARASFDLVLLDPPFDAPAREQALEAAAGLVRVGGYLFFEAPGDLPLLPAGYQLWREDRAGSVRVHLLRRVAPDPAAATPAP